MPDMLAHVKQVLHRRPKGGIKRTRENSLPGEEDTAVPEMISHNDVDWMAETRSSHLVQMYNGDYVSDETGQKHQSSDWAIHNDTYQTRILLAFHDSAGDFLNHPAVRPHNVKLIPRSPVFEVTDVSRSLSEALKPKELFLQSVSSRQDQDERRARPTTPQHCTDDESVIIRTRTIPRHITGEKQDEISMQDSPDVSQHSGLSKTFGEELIKYRDYPPLRRVYTREQIQNKAVSSNGVELRGYQRLDQSPSPSTTSTSSPTSSLPSPSPSSSSSSPSTTATTSISRQPAITNEHIRPHIDTILHPHRTRSYHIHEHHTKIQPIIDSNPEIILSESHSPTQQQKQPYLRDPTTGDLIRVANNLEKILENVMQCNREIS